MARKTPKNQLPLDFTVSSERLILVLGQPAQQQAAREFFDGLCAGQWVLEPAGEVADVSSAQEIIRQLGGRLAFPEVVKVAQLHQADTSFVGFSAVYKQKGWVVVNAQADAPERSYHTHVLTATLGLFTAYPSTEALYHRAEQLVMAHLLPAQEVATFFYEGISTITATLAHDIASFFNVPYSVVLKRALALGIVTDEQFRQFMTVKPARKANGQELYISPEGSLDDLEARLFGEEES
jgi:Zn-dependent peptidase ImmA (M78 family)